MISEHVNEPFINQDHLDELEKLRGEIIEATGIKATHKEGVMQLKSLKQCKSFN